MKLKFTNDGGGWRDLRVGDRDDGVRVSLLDERKFSRSNCDPFISVSEDGKHYASFRLTKRQLRKFAKAILRETKK